MTQIDIAIFDLDHTLIAADSSALWFEHLMALGWVPRAQQQRHQQLMADYEQSTLDMGSYLQLSLAPLIGRTRAEVDHMAQVFVQQQVWPLLYSQVPALLAWHQQQGHQLLLISASEDFLVQPWLHLLPFDDVIGVETECVDDRYTGNAGARISYGSGKITALDAWLASRQLTLGNSYFYSDSHNDLPLLQRVTFPRPTHANARLRQLADDHHWPLWQLQQRQTFA